MRITYRTLGRLIEKMSEEQKDADLTVEVPGEFGAECFAAELRVADENHDGGLDVGHPVIYTHSSTSEEHERRSDVEQIVVDIGLGCDRVVTDDDIKITDHFDDMWRDRLER